MMTSQAVQELVIALTHTHAPTNRRQWKQYYRRYAIASRVVNSRQQIFEI